MDADDSTATSPTNFSDVLVINPPSHNEDEDHAQNVQYQQHLQQHKIRPNFNLAKNKKKFFKKSSAADQNRTNANVSFNESSAPPMGPPLHTKSVSMILTINKSEMDQETKNNWKIIELVSLLSTIYAIVIIIWGILFPLAETLKGVWLNTIYNAVFLLYLYTVATIFMIYLQITLINPKFPCKPHKNQDDNAHNDINDDDVIDSMTYNNNNFHNNELEEIDKGIAHNNLSSGGMYPSTLSVNDYKDPDNDFETHYAKKHGASGLVTAFLRINSTTHLTSQSVPSGINRCTTQQEVRQGLFGRINTYDDDELLEAKQCQNALLDEIPQVDEVRCTTEEITEEVFIDLTQLGTIFSHHGSSFFLRIGTLLFGVGHMIFIILEIQNNLHLGKDCNAPDYWWVFIARLIFVVVQTFVIFKNPGITVKKEREALLRFGFMHVIATNMCIWVRTLLSEITLEALSYLKSNETNSAEANCTDSFLQTAAPYLFPFVLEYSLLCISVIAVMYWTIGEHSKDNIQKGITNLFKVDVFVNDEKSESASIGGHESGGHESENLFSKSHRGIFLGCLLLTGVIIVIVFFNFSISTIGDPIRAEFISLSSDLVLIILLLAVVVVGLIQMSPLSFIKKPSSIDDALLIIAMFGGIMYHTALVMAASYALSQKKYKLSSLEILRVICSAVNLIFLFVQVILVTSALRRYPSKHSHVVKKPGRGAITFLITGNIASWIFHSILTKNHDLQYTPGKMFGKIPWIILLNISLPLLLFFFFHSSVCLADIWHQAYIPLQSNVHKPTPPHTQEIEESTQSQYHRSNLADDDYGSTTSNIAFNHANNRAPIKPASLSAINFLSPLMRSVSVSQLSQVPAPQPQNQSLSSDLYHGSFSRLPEQPYFTLPKRKGQNKVNRLSPILSPTGNYCLEINNNEYGVHM